LGRSPEKLRSLREQPFDLDLNFAKIILSQNDGSSVARQRQLLRDLAARAIKRVTNTPRPDAGFSAPNLVKCFAVNCASLQQRDRAVLDLNVPHFGGPIHTTTGSTTRYPHRLYQLAVERLIFRFLNTPLSSTAA
jgi:hypothetical protein